MVANTMYVASKGGGGGRRVCPIPRTLSRYKHFFLNHHNKKGGATTQHILDADKNKLIIEITKFIKKIEVLLVGSYRSSLNTPTHPKPPDWSFEDFWEKFIAFWYLFLLDFFLPSDISDKHWHQLSKAEVSRLTFLGLIISHEKNFQLYPKQASIPEMATAYYFCLCFKNSRPLTFRVIHARMTGTFFNPKYPCLPCY